MRLGLRTTRSRKANRHAWRRRAGKTGPNRDAWRSDFNCAGVSWPDPEGEWQPTIRSSWRRYSRHHEPASRRRSQRTTISRSIFSAEQTLKPYDLSYEEIYLLARRAVAAERRQARRRSAARAAFAAPQDQALVLISGRTARGQ
jgi:hypothetical protein